ncbi:MAG: ABC transporter substrate-binding protein [Treponema sp.]|nr:ABC transporter substrate-binding protein [Treponema sp.]
MMKRLFFAGMFLCVVLSLAMARGGGEQTIKIGFNIPLTGNSPKIGESAKNSGELVKKQINDAGGLDVGGKKYQVDFIYVDNELKPESAVQAAIRLIEQDRVLAIVGPAGSGRAIPAGQINNDNRTPMVSPWATNPDVTKNRPYVFRACILDPVQAPAAVKFAAQQFANITRAAVLYNVEDDYSNGLAALFRSNWEAVHGAGSIRAFESFGENDKDFSVQLTKIVNTDAQLLYLPDYYNHVALIVPQAKNLGWGDKPVLGSDSWGSTDLVTLSNNAVKGYYFTDHFAAAGATGITKAFIDQYIAAYKESPDSVAALTYDSAKIALQAIQNAGLTGNLQNDREAIKNAIVALKDYAGVTGNMTFNADGDPDKTAVVVQISDSGEFTFVTNMK